MGNQFHLGGIILNAFFFDLDGTIWDSNNIIASAIYDTLKQIAKIETNESEIQHELTLYTSPFKLLQEYGISDYSYYWKFYREKCECIQLYFENTAHVLNRLKENGKSIAYITSLKSEFSMKLLQKYNLDHFADAIITPSECRARKPNPKPIIMAIDICRVEKTSTIYIGDRDIDILAAKRAGCKSGLATWGVEGRISEKPDYRFENIYEILNLLQS